MDLGKYLLLYLCMALAVSFFFPQTILSNQDTSILGIFHVGLDSNNQPYLNSTGFSDSDLNNQVNNDETESGFWHVVQKAGGVFQWIVDGLGNVLGTIKILFKFTFSPFIFVMSPDLLGGAPFFVQLIFAIPLVFMVFYAGLKFIRGLQ